METSILDHFNLESELGEETLKTVYGSKDVQDDQLPIKDKLKLWLAVLPQNIRDMIDLALQQERPFLPPDVTPEMMAAPNDKLAPMNEIEILYRCLDIAMRAKDFRTASAIVFVVDRATYRFGTSRGLLKIVDLIMAESVETPIAPQVVIRKSRVMKDDGDLHGAMKVLDAVITKKIPWDYKTEDQYHNVKAVCVQIKGQILHNLGLWKEALEPLVDSVISFEQIHDDKGTSSSLGLLARCLNKLSVQDFEEIRNTFSAFFENNHPCLEAYIQGVKAVRYIQDLGQTLYVAKHQLIAEESLLMYAIQQTSDVEEYRWFQTIIHEMRNSLGGHQTVDFLKSSESFFEFVRAVFMISLTLSYSPVSEDRDVGKYLEQLSIELYRHLCSQNRGQLILILDHTRNSVLLMNTALRILSLPPLKGSDQFPPKESKQNQSSSSSTSSKQDSMHRNQSGSTSSSSSHPPVITESWSLEVSPPVTAGGDSCDGNQSASVDQESDSVGDDKSSHKSEVSFRTRGEELNSSAEKIIADRDNDHAATYCAGVANQSKVQTNPSTFPVLEKEKNSALRPSACKPFQKKFVGLTVDLDESFSAQSFDFVSEDTDYTDCSDSAVLVNLSATSISSTADMLTKLSDFSSPDELSAVTQSTDCTSSSSSADRQTSSDNSTGPDKSSSTNETDLGNTSRQTNSSSDLSPLVDLSASTKSSTSELSPLVDMSCSTLNDTFEDLRLGESIATNDSLEYLQNWHPRKELDIEFPVHRATLRTYNPVTGQWTFQSTLAYTGSDLNLADDKKGKCRDAFEVKFLHQDEPLGRYVGKRYRRQREPTHYMQDVVCQMMAGYYVIRFNQALQNYKSDVQVQFLPAAHLQLLTPDGQLENWINVEPYLHGDFIKLTNNLEYCNPRGREMATALTHFSYCESRGVLMIVDLQGWLPSEDSGIIYLTDPQFHTQGIKKFSPYDHQAEGMKKFWTKVHPVCNTLCNLLKLSRPENYK